MNDPILLANKLAELIQLAKEASTGFEKAAVYSATSCILKKFYDVEGKFDSYVLEKAAGTCSHINAVIGFDVDNGHDKSSHISWACGDLMTLKSLLNERAENV